MAISLTPETKSSISLGNEGKNLIDEVWDSGVWDTGFWDANHGLQLSAESKNSLAVTNENKYTGGAFGDFPGRTFADGGTFGQPGTFLGKENKNTLSISNESKN